MAFAEPTPTGAGAAGGAVHGFGAVNVTPRSKLVSLPEAAALVQDGDHVTIGGVMLHRIPAAFVRELARQGRRRLRLSKPSPSYDLDLLCAAGCLAEVDAGVASLESAFGGALPSYRRAVEAGLVRVREFS